MKNKELNFAEILKGHEGNKFFTLNKGSLTLSHIDYDKELIFFNETPEGFHLNGTFHDKKYGICMLFPSRDLYIKYGEPYKAWEEWMQAPKTWNDMVLEGSAKDYSFIGENTPVEKSAFALLKIHQLIDKGYGGNITRDYWELEHTTKYVIKCTKDDGIGIFTYFDYKDFSPIAFYSLEQASRFMNYKENIQLIKDYYMIV